MALGSFYSRKKNASHKKQQKLNALFIQQTFKTLEDTVFLDMSVPFFLGPRPWNCLSPGSLFQPSPDLGFTRQIFHVTNLETKCSEKDRLWFVVILGILDFEYQPSLSTCWFLTRQNTTFLPTYTELPDITVTSSLVIRGPL